MTIVSNNSKKVENATINDLPEEILVKIFGNLTFMNLAQIKRVARVWDNASNEIFKLFPLPKNWQIDKVFQAKLVSDLIIRAGTKNPEKHIRNNGNRAADGEEFIVFTEQGVGLPKKIIIKSLRGDRFVKQKKRTVNEKSDSFVAVHYSVTETKVSQVECFSRFEKKYKKVIAIALLSAVVALVVFAVIIGVKSQTNIDNNSSPSTSYSPASPAEINPVYLQDT